MPPSRLKGTSDFQRVRRQGQSWSHPLLVLIACRNDRREIRLGLTAARTVGGAVARNRARRRLRAALRQMTLHAAAGWDVVLIARPPLVGAKWPDVIEALRGLLRQAALLGDSERPC